MIKEEERKKQKYLVGIYKRIPNKNKEWILMAITVLSVAGH